MAQIRLHCTTDDGKVIGRDLQQSEPKPVTPVSPPARQIKRLRQRADQRGRGIQPIGIAVAFPRLTCQFQSGQPFWQHPSAQQIFGQHRAFAFALRQCDFNRTRPAGDGQTVQNLSRRTVTIHNTRTEQL